MILSPKFFFFEVSVSDTANFQLAYFLLGNFEVQNNLLAGSIPKQFSGLKNIELFRIDGNAGVIGSIPESVCDTFGTTTISYSDCRLESFECECCTYCCAGGICECNISDADICGEDLTGARAPFL